MPKLTRSDTIDLIDWLRKEETKTTYNKVGYIKLAKLANTTLDLTNPATQSSIGSLVRDLGLEEHYTVAKRVSPIDRIADLQDQLDHICSFLKKVGNINGFALVDQKDHPRGGHHKP